MLQYNACNVALWQVHCQCPVYRRHLPTKFGSSSTPVDLVASVARYTVDDMDGLMDSSSKAKIIFHDMHLLWAVHCIHPFNSASSLQTLLPLTVGATHANEAELNVHCYAKLS